VPTKMCLICGALSSQSRCPVHRTKQARGYGTEHQIMRQKAIAVAPYCWNCGCPITECKLELHHVTPMYGGRNQEKDDRRQLLCKRCHDSVKEN
jgi:5-methylcytosine-specific restriction endonuclease McrA